MTRDPAALSARAEELLAARALGDLSPLESVELAQLLGAQPELEHGEFDSIAAALELADLGAGEPMPEGLAERLAAQAEALLALQAEGGPLEAPARIQGPLPAARASAGHTPPAAPAGTQRVRRAARAPGARPPRRRGSLVAPILSAAAAAVVAVWIVRPAAPPQPAEQRLALLETPGSVSAAWQPVNDPTGIEASGDVVWNDAAQRGYMRFRGLAPNDPSVEQYQLWIFDRAREEARPVDGGVFDVPGEEEVVVPIDPKLLVTEARQFAVTVERPGGVVVSSRERIALLAAVGP